MFVHARGFDAVWSYIEGFNAARSGEPLKGFREWLLLRRGSFSNLPWFMLIREHVFASTDPGALPQRHEHVALLEALRAALAGFKMDRDNIGVEGILRRYEPLWDAIRTR